MEGKGLTATTESKVFAVQEQEIAVKVTMREVWKEDIEEVNCRLCKKRQGNSRSYSVLM